MRISRGVAKVKLNKMHLFALKLHFAAKTVKSISKSVFTCTLLKFFNNYRFKKMLHTLRKKKEKKGKELDAFQSY